MRWPSVPVVVCENRALALEPAPPSAAEVRSWAALEGVEVSDRGRIPGKVMRAYLEAHR